MRSAVLLFCIEVQDFLYKKDRNVFAFFMLTCSTLLHINKIITHVQNVCINISFLNMLMQIKRTCFGLPYQTLWLVMTKCHNDIVTKPPIEYNDN